MTRKHKTSGNTKHSSILGISDRSVRRILHDDLHCHPHKMAILQELSERDFTSRGTHATLLENVPEDAIIYFSDEAHLTGCVSKQNMRYWADTNPQ